MAGEAWCKACMALVVSSRERAWKSVRVWQKPVLLSVVPDLEAV